MNADDISPETWKSPNGGWSWAIYINGLLRVQGLRFDDEPEARRFMEANVKLLDPERKMRRVLR